MQKTLHNFCKQLGYSFKEIAWLELALTHRSYSGKNNERLEFLGDSLLNFCIAEKLFHEYPDYHEGDLSRLRANLVNGEVLAALAGKLKISQYIRLGAGELKSGGLQRKSILSNAVEAIIGAIYLDGGLDACRQRISTWFTDAFMQAASRGMRKDPKTQLQEYTQAQKMTLPIYTKLSVQGDEHLQLFSVKCSVPGLSSISVGTGTTRKGAEQDAAAKLLRLLGVSA